MAIQFQCPDCGKSLRVKEEHAGRKTRCLGCKAVIQVPQANEQGEDDFYAELADEDSGQSTRLSRRARQGATRTRRNRPQEDEELPRMSKKKKSSKKSQSSSSGGLPIWVIGLGAGVVSLLVVGGVVGLAMSLGTSSGENPQASESGKKQPAAGKKSEFIVGETNTPVADFKMTWEMPAKWTAESGVEEGMWPWAHLKGQGQTIKISTNKSLTEISSTATSFGGPLEQLKTAHTVRISKLQAEYTDFVDGPLNVHQGKRGPVIWSEYEYKGILGKGYGIRCTVPGPGIFPTGVIMEGGKVVHEKWRPVVLHVADSIDYELLKKKGQEDLEPTPGEKRDPGAEVQQAPEEEPEDEPAEKNVGEQPTEPPGGEF